MNRSFARKAFTKTEKLYLHTKNIQELEISISETSAVAELGASTFAFCRRTKLLIQSVSQNNVIYSASDVLHDTHLFTQGQRENGNQDPDMTSSCNSRSTEREANAFSPLKLTLESPRVVACFWPKCPATGCLMLLWCEHLKFRICTSLRHPWEFTFQTPLAGTAEQLLHLWFFTSATQSHHASGIARVTVQGKPQKLLVNIDLFHMPILNYCFNRSHKAGVTSTQQRTCLFFSFCSKILCRFFFCFLLRGFFCCCTTHATFFFFAFLAGRTRALLPSIPFSVASSKRMCLLIHLCQVDYFQHTASRSYRKPC